MKKGNVISRMSNLEKRRNLATNAMPEVKKLVQKYDRAAIQRCLNQLRDYSQKIKKLEEAKREVEKLQEEVN